MNGLENKTKKVSPTNPSCLRYNIYIKLYLSVQSLIQRTTEQVCIH